MQQQNKVVQWFVLGGAEWGKQNSKFFSLIKSFKNKQLYHNKEKGFSSACPLLCSLLC